MFVALAFLATAALAQSLTFPDLTGRVVDDAGIIDAATRQALEKLSADLEAKTTDQLVVVTLKSLQGTSIDDYGYQLGRHWQIGQKGKNNGVLLIVAPNERRVRIDVGYGLEPTLTDAITSVIRQSSIAPRFRAGDFAGGILAGAQDIVQVLTGDAEEYKRRAEQRRRATSQISSGEWVVIAFWLIVLALIIMNVINDMRRRGSIAPGNVRRGRDRGGYNPIIIGSGSSGGGWSGGGWSGGGDGGFSGGGGSFGGGGSSGSW